MSKRFFLVVPLLVLFFSSVNSQAQDISEYEGLYTLVDSTGYCPYDNVEAKVDWSQNQLRVVQETGYGSMGYFFYLDNEVRVFPDDFMTWSGDRTNNIGPTPKGHPAYQMTVASCTGLFEWSAKRNCGRWILEHEVEFISQGALIIRDFKGTLEPHICKYEQFGHF